MEKVKNYRIQIGLGLGLVSKHMSKEEAEKIQHLVDVGGLHSWVIKAIEVKQK